VVQTSMPLDFKRRHIDYCSSIFFFLLIANKKKKSQIRSVVVRQVGRISKKKTNRFTYDVYSIFQVNLTKIFPAVAEVGLPVPTYPNANMLKSANNRL